MTGRRLPLVVIACGCTLITAFAVQAEPPSLRQQALDAYEAEDFATCADLYQQSAEQKGARQEQQLYNSACCAALAGDAGRALDTLDHLARDGFRDLTTLREDDDLSTLRSSKRWPPLVAKVEANDETFRQRIHPELLRLHQEDQADRRQQPIDWSKVSARDTERRQRVTEILAADEAKEAEDFYHAAMIFQHGNAVEDFARARELAGKAVELNPQLMDAKWLWAAATDRWLHRQKKPQIYGTQYRKASPDSPWTLEPLDADAVTDEERAAHGVPPLADARARVEAMNAAETP